MVTQQNNPAKRKSNLTEALYTAQVKWKVYNYSILHIVNAQQTLNIWRNMRQMNYQGIYDLRSQDYYMFISKTVSGIPTKYQGPP